MIAKQTDRRNNSTSNFRRLYNYLTSDLDPYKERQFGRYAES
jgi:hypothetical protein